MGFCRGARELARSEAKQASCSLTSSVVEPDVFAILWKRSRRGRLSPYGCPLRDCLVDSGPVVDLLMFKTRFRA